MKILTIPYSLLYLTRPSNRSLVSLGRQLKTLNSIENNSLFKIQKSCLSEQAGVAKEEPHTQTTKPSLSAQVSRNIIAQRSYFDTHLFVSQLESSGFNRQQAEQLCALFKEIVNFISQDIKKDCVTKSGQVGFLF